MRVIIVCFKYVFDDLVFFFRYTPWLAWMLYPNITVSNLFGKILFCGFDVFAGFIIYCFVRDFPGTREPPMHSELKAKFCSFAWLYNPLVFVVSARGNAESIVTSLVLLSIYLFHERVLVLSGLVFGLAVHFKIYPIIYSISFFMALTGQSGWRSLVDINQARIRFILGAAVSFGLSTSLAYLMYGQEFLDEAYLYHIWRRDIRHNFSPYFYMLYLTVEVEDIGLTLLTFLPQLILLVAITKKFANAKDLAFCLFCQTVVFVAYNKVITSQYFLWYLSLLPLCITKVRFSRYEATICTLIWAVTQASWLLPAYYLEFQGVNSFLVICVESLAFFTANVGLLSKFVRKYREFQVSAVAVDMNKVD